MGVLGRSSATSVLKVPDFSLLHTEGGGVIASGDSETKERLREEEVKGESEVGCFGFLVKL